MAAVTGGTIYTNADGLRQRFGTDQSADAKEGVRSTNGLDKEHIFELDAADMPAFGTETFLNGVPSVSLPAGDLLVSATLIVTVAFAGATATLGLGTAEKDGTTIDADGIDAAIAVTAIDAVGDTIACDGALVGTILGADDSYLTLTVGTATFTAGQAKLVIVTRKP